MGPNKIHRQQNEREYGFDENWTLFETLPKIHCIQIECEYAWIRTSGEVESGQLANATNKFWSRLNSIEIELSWVEYENRIGMSCTWMQILYMPMLKVMHMEHCAHTKRARAREREWNTTTIT